MYFHLVYTVRSIDQTYHLLARSSPDLTVDSSKQSINMSNNGTNGSTASVSRFDPHFTDNVINATGPKASPRLRKVMGSLTRHLHDFCRENEITIDEYMAAIEMVS